MADLSILYETSTLGIVDKAIEAAGAKKKPRRYLGMSEIGDICSRRLWIKYHGGFVPKFSAQMLRRFEMGHIIERCVVRDLKRAGFKVSGRQKVFKDFKGKFKGHCDGIVEGLEESSTPHILEVKSASDKWFKDFLKNGMMSNPKYSGQHHCYLGYAGLERGFFVLENRDNSQRHQERVHFDRSIFERMKEKARLIIDAKSPPSGIHEREDWFECRWCPLNNAEWCRRDWDRKDGVPF